MQAILDAVQHARQRVELCATGPRTILAAEHEMAAGRGSEPGMKGKRILIADDETFELLNGTMGSIFISYLRASRGKRAGPLNVVTSHS